MPNYGPRPLDPIKKAIAEAIQKGGIAPLASYQPLLDMDDVVEVEVQVINPTETLVRVKTQSHGVRYFHNKLREMM
jgi:hypothetical protein